MLFHELLETFLHLKATVGEWGVRPWGLEVGPRLYIDIRMYTRISPARLARAQFSWTSSWRPRPSLGGTGSAFQTWTPLLVGRGGELGLTIQADNAS